MDQYYVLFFDILHKEMGCSSIVLKTKSYHNTNQRYWNKVLHTLWNVLLSAKKSFLKCKDPNKRNALKDEFKNCQYNFDKKFRFFNRQFRRGKSFQLFSLQ